MSAQLVDLRSYRIRRRAQAGLALLPPAEQARRAPLLLEMINLQMAMGAMRCRQLEDGDGIVQG